MHVLILGGKEDYWQDQPGFNRVQRYVGVVALLQGSCEPRKRTTTTACIYKYTHIHFWTADVIEQTHTHS